MTATSLQPESSAFPCQPSDHPPKSDSNAVVALVQPHARTSQAAYSQMQTLSSLQPAQSIGFHRAAAVAASAAVPGTWNLLDPRALHHALHTLMPGAWSFGHITRLSRYMPGGPKFLREDGRPELASTHPEEVAVLLKSVDLSWCGCVCDPWSGTGTIKRVLTAEGHVVYTNDICTMYEADTHHDALQPRFYEQGRAQGRLNAIVCSPWFKVIDIAPPWPSCTPPTWCACMLPAISSPTPRHHADSG